MKYVVPLIILLGLCLPAFAAANSLEQLHDSVDRKLKLADARAALSPAETMRLRARMNQITKLIHKQPLGGQRSLSEATMKLHSIEQEIDEANRRSIASRRLLRFF